MFACAHDDLRFTDGILDLTFSNVEEWPGAGGVRFIMFTIGDPICGPLLTPLGHPPTGTAIDWQAQLKAMSDLMHLHRTDSFRISIAGDQVVGRTIYGPDGLFRLQEAGRIYGPESPGPLVASGDVPNWMVLCFGDKRGWELSLAKSELQAQLDEQIARTGVLSMYESVGAWPAFPRDSNGESAVASSTGAPLRAGHIDASFEDAAGWSQLGEGNTAISAIGHRERGGLILTTETPTGTAALPSAIWDTEVVLFIVAGDADIDGMTLRRGDFRVIAAGTQHPAVVAGSDGLQHILVIGDRRRAIPTWCATPEWGEGLQPEIHGILATLS